MKKLLFFFLMGLMLLTLGNLPVNSQVKVKFKLMNPGVDATGKFYFKLVAVVQPGQTWKVGSSNIRIAFRTIPVGGLTIKPDSIAGMVQEPLACINSGGYSPLTTTAINSRTRISFNITRTGNCCYLTAGTYVLGRVRFNRIDTTSCTIDTITTGTGSASSVVQDSVTALAYGTGWTDSNFTTCTLITDVPQNQQLIPTVFKLHNNYPNPFNPSTTIKYDIPKTAYVKLVIYDILGKEVDVLVDQQLKAGYYEFNWNASNYASGTYIYKLETNNGYSDVKKMILMK